MSNLTGSRVLVFDNGKTSGPYTHWKPLVDALLVMASDLAEQAVVEYESADILREDLESMTRRAQRWQASGYDLVLLAVCDAGSVVPTIRQAVSAEALGIRTASIALEGVRDLATSSAWALASGLEVLVLPLTPADSPDDMRRKLQAETAPLRSRLLAGPGGTDQVVTRMPFLADLYRDGPTDRTDSFEAFVEQSGMGSGFRLYPPLLAEIDRFLELNSMDGDEILIRDIAPSGADVSVRDAAAAVVMVGGSSTCLPVVAAALCAMSRSEYLLSTMATTTTHPSGHLILVSGPLAQAAGISSGRGCLGPGQAANIAVGRAVNLILEVRSAAAAGSISLSIFGSAAQFSMCLADAATPGFPSLNGSVSPATSSVVVVQKTEAPRNILDHLSTTAEGIATSIALGSGTPRSNNAFIPSNLVILLNPQHAQIMAKDGWTRRELAEYVSREAGNPRNELVGGGASPLWPGSWESRDHLPIVRDAADVIVAVAGGPGPQSMVSSPWAFSPATWVEVGSDGRVVGEPHLWDSETQFS